MVYFQKHLISQIWVSGHCLWKHPLLCWQSSPYCRQLSSFLCETDTDSQSQTSVQSALASLDLRVFDTSVVTSSSMDTVYRCFMHAFALIHLNAGYINTEMHNATQQELSLQFHKRHTTLLFCKEGNVTSTRTNTISNSSRHKQAKLEQTPERHCFCRKCHCDWYETENLSKWDRDMPRSVVLFAVTCSCEGDSSRSSHITVVIMYQKVGKPEGDSAEPRQRNSLLGLSFPCDTYLTNQRFKPITVLLVSISCCSF